MTPPVSDAYFLTRQAANLMEDFARQLAEGSSIYLLYGESGIGKSRLLRELQRTRLGERRVHRIDLKITGPSAGVTLDRSAEIVKLFSKTGKDDIIIADHFESASHKTRHQLFKCWKIDGKKKQLNFVISCVTHGFNDLRQLSQLYKLRIQSFQQMPFSRDEVDAFVGFYLFPDDQHGKLAMPPALRRELTNSRGNVGQVIEIANREGAQVKMVEDDESESKGSGRPGILAMLAAGLLLGTGLLWYFADQQDVIRESSLSVDHVIASMSEANAPEVIIAESPQIKLQPATAVVAQTQPVPPQEVEQAETRQPALLPEPEPQAEVAMAAADSESNRVEIAAPAAVTVEEKIEVSAPDSVEVIAVVSNPTPEEIVQPAKEMSPAVPPEDSLQQRLKDSLQWLKRPSRSGGTVQIMRIGTDSLDELAYQSYIEQLEDNSVDTSKIRIFRAKTTNGSVYNVFYGEYPSRQEASNAVAGLPARLRSSKPFPRTVGGIRDEISR